MLILLIIKSLFKKQKTKVLIPTYLSVGRWLWQSKFQFVFTQKTFKKLMIGELI